MVDFGKKMLKSTSGKRTIGNGKKVKVDSVILGKHEYRYGSKVKVYSG
jgi:hypothetical protein